MVHSEFQAIQIAGTGRDSTGTHPTSRKTSYKLAEKNLPLHPSGRITTHRMARNEGCFYSQGRKGHPHHSKGLKANKPDIVPALKE